MARTFYKFLSLLGPFLFLCTAHLYATHIRAGEITARRIDPQRPIYEITVTGYADTDSPVLFGSNGRLDYGDGSFEDITNEGSDSWIPRERISEDTWKYTLTRIHTFPGQKTYKISFRELFRNEGVLNMDNSVNMPFYIETVIVIDAFIGVNNTPQLLVPPVDKGAVGKLYLHNPGAYDVDGDSLSYRLVFCKQDENVPVANYRFPDETFPEGDPGNGTSLEGGESTFTLDPLTGDLVWNTPGTKGEYNAAFFIEEWRKIDGEFYFLGYVTRDMQIIIEETENEPPVLQMPNDTCVVAGTVLEADIIATDPDGDMVKIESYGGVYEGLGASITPGDGEFQQEPASVRFRWETSCANVQERPYAIQFKATDARGGGVSLTDLQTWNVTVIAPAPEISSVQVVDSRTADLNFNWEDYFCGDAASQVQVWRRINSNDFEPGACETGMPAGMGYELVSTRGITDFPFRDNRQGQGLTPGATYCYRIVAVFPQPKGGESIVSEEICVTLPASVPLITKASVLTTDEETGSVEVRWIRPLEVDEADFPPPYTYDLYRGEGFTGGPYTLIQENTSDTSFVDTGLNTSQEVYNYYVMFRSKNAEVDSSAAASTVRLTPQPMVGGIELNWQAEVPWSNQVQEAAYHYIYRNKVPGRPGDELVLIDSVNAIQQGFSYLDDGSITGEGQLTDTVEYCYFVTTSGSYGNPQIPSPLLNNSQVVCTMPFDDIPPCPPVTFELNNLMSCEEIIQQADCALNQFENRLTWTPGEGEECQDDIAYWEVFYSPTGEEGTFEVVGQSTRNSFIHDNLTSMAGFYYIVAVDRSGNRSEESNLVQNDNCPNYWLPNVFTPNGDGINDVFGAPLGSSIPSRCPRFVQTVVFRVFNRWGREVFTYNSADREGEERSIYIDWTGRGNNGELLSAGVYYYVADVTYEVLDPSRRSETLKGWITLVEGDVPLQDETGGTR